MRPLWQYSDPRSDLFYVAKNLIINFEYLDSECKFITILESDETSFLLKRNVPNDLNKMISKVYGCKMGQGEWQVFS